MLTLETEKAMVETFQGEYVSLHVRVSNQAALRLYRDTLGFKEEKIEAKYYADGEDAHSMKLDLNSIKNELAAEDPEDEGDAVGDEGKQAEEEAERKKRHEIAARLAKIRLEKQGFGEVIEKNEAQKA